MMAKRTVAQFVGFAGTQRVLTKDDQNQIAGVDRGVGREDLVWEPGNTKIDVTDVHEDVVAYLKGSDEFKVREVEVDDDPSSTDAGSSEGTDQA